MAADSRTYRCDNSLRTVAPVVISSTPSLNGLASAPAYISLCSSTRRQGGYRSPPFRNSINLLGRSNNRIITIVPEPPIAEIKSICVCHWKSLYAFGRLADAGRGRPALHNSATPQEEAAVQLT